MDLSQNRESKPAEINVERETATSDGGERKRGRTGSDVMTSVLYISCYIEQFTVSLLADISVRLNQHRRRLPQNILKSSLLHYTLSLMYLHTVTDKYFYISNQ